MPETETAQLRKEIRVQIQGKCGCCGRVHPRPQLGQQVVGGGGRLLQKRPDDGQTNVSFAGAGQETIVRVYPMDLAVLGRGGEKFVLWMSAVRSRRTVR